MIELPSEKPKPEFHFKQARTSGKLIFETKELVIGYDEPLSRPLNLRMERGQKIALYGANGIGKTTLLKSLLGKFHRCREKSNAANTFISAISSRKSKRPTTTHA